MKVTLQTSGYLRFHDRAWCHRKRDANTVLRELFVSNSGRNLVFCAIVNKAQWSPHFCKMQNSNVLKGSLVKGTKQTDQLRRGLFALDTFVCSLFPPPCSIVPAQLHCFVLLGIFAVRVKC